MIDEEVIIDEHIQYQRARSNVYLLLANAFLGNWGELKKASYKVDEINGDQSLGYLINEIIETPMEEIKIQFDNLFVAPGYYFVPPFASFHLNLVDDDLDEYTNHLYRIYGRWNYDLPFRNFERGDHIGYLLMFVHFSIEALLCQPNDTLQETQSAFIKKQLYSWMLKFTAEVEKKLARGLLLDIVKFTTKFVEWDLQQLE